MHAVAQALPDFLDHPTTSQEALFALCWLTACPAAANATSHSDFNAIVAAVNENRYHPEIRRWGLPTLQNILRSGESDGAAAGFVAAAGEELPSTLRGVCDHLVRGPTPVPTATLLCNVVAAVAKHLGKTKESVAKHLGKTKESERRTLEGCVFVCVALVRRDGGAVASLDRGELALVVAACAALRHLPPRSETTRSLTPLLTALLMALHTVADSCAGVHEGLVGAAGTGSRSPASPAESPAADAGANTGPVGTAAARWLMYTLYTYATQSALFAIDLVQYQRTHALDVRGLVAAVLRVHGYDGKTREYGQALIRLGVRPRACNGADDGQSAWTRCSRACLSRSYRVISWHAVSLLFRVVSLV